MNGYKAMAVKLRALIFPAKGAASSSEMAAAQPTLGLLIGLMVPTMLMALNIGMFGVAVPVIRSDFKIQADMAAWVVTAYSLPFMMFMPVYGRLGDILGKRRLFLAGIIIFLAGTVITLLAPGLGWLMAGRATQGLGGAGIVPLCIAIISQRFPPAERGKAMGTWNSVIPMTNLVGPYLGGLFIDHLGWRAIYAPILVAGAVAIVIVLRTMPAPANPIPLNSNFLRRFDWGGVLLLAGALTSLLFYASSRPITGVAPLQDWRLLASTVLFLMAFIYWEKQQANPFIALNIFANTTFSMASLCAGIRMFTMSGINFLIPLYLADVYGLSAAATGIVLTLHAGALFLVLRVGGQAADRWGSRWPVIVSMLVQTGMMVYLALLPAAASLWLVGLAIASHGLGAGLSLAALHRAAMARVSERQTGVAAGLYSMLRFGGSLFGTALGGVVLQSGLDRQLMPIEAYQMVFWFIAGVALIGTLLGFGLRE